MCESPKKKIRISHSPSTRQHYPGTARRVFAPVSTLLVLEWNLGTAGKERDYRLETVTWEHGGEGKGEGGEGMVRVLVNSPRGTAENRGEQTCGHDVALGGEERGEGAVPRQRREGGGRRAPVVGTSNPHLVLRVVRIAAQRVHTDAKWKF